jgi:uncharacterized protein YndB with AHSA1/START domain
MAGLGLVVKRVIHAPPAVVFAVYTDPSRLSDWQPGVRAVVDQTGPSDRPGSSFALDQPGSRLRITVLQVDPPHLHEQLESLGWYSWITTARFDELSGGRTRLSLRYTPRPRGVGWPLAPLLMSAGFLFMRREVELLRSVAERAARDPELGRFMEAALVHPNHGVAGHAECSQNCADVICG